MYLPRSRAGTTSATMDCEEIMRPPAPMPWMVRPMIRSSMVWAKPPKVEPIKKKMMAVR